MTLDDRTGVGSHSGHAWPFSGNHAVKVYKFNARNLTPLLPLLAVPIVVMATKIGSGTLSWSLLLGVLSPYVLTGGLFGFLYLRQRIEVGDAGMRFSGLLLRRARDFYWADLASISEQKVAFGTKKLSVLVFELRGGHTFRLGLDGGQADAYISADAKDAQPLIDAIKQYYGRPLNISQGPISALGNDMGREATHVSYAAVALALAALALMMVSDQHYLNSHGYFPYLVGASIMMALVAIAYQRRLEKRVNMIMPTILLALASAWFVWALLLKASAVVGEPVTVRFVVGGSEEADKGHLESTQYWRSEDPRLPRGKAGVLELWADPGHFRYAAGEAREVALRIIPLLGVPTISRNDYNALLAPLKSQAGAPRSQTETTGGSPHEILSERK